MDSQGRLFVGDRNNNRIQIFDQDGRFMAEWKQFSRPSGIFIDRNDTIYVPILSPSRFATAIRVGDAASGLAAPAPVL
jgi:hypothetical protein